jgi:hypothetical protein
MRARTAFTNRSKVARGAMRVVSFTNFEFQNLQYFGRAFNSLFNRSLEVSTSRQ